MLCSCAIISSYIKTLHLFITPSAPLDLLPPSPLHNLLPLPNPLHNLLPLLPFSGMSGKSSLVVISFYNINQEPSILLVLYNQKKVELNTFQNWCLGPSQVNWDSFQSNLKSKNVFFDFSISDPPQIWKLTFQGSRGFKNEF